MENIYLSNKYTIWYYQIIDSARVRIKNNAEYYERHHIIPKSLGGSNDPINLVYLTAREHFICHLLLTKMVTGKMKKSMDYAAWNMINGHKI